MPLPCRRFHHRAMFSHPAVTIPDDLIPVVENYRTCELLTISGSGTPVAWPTISVVNPDGTLRVGDGPSSHARSVYRRSRADGADQHDHVHCRVASHRSSVPGTAWARPTAGRLGGDPVLSAEIKADRKNRAAA